MRVERLARELGVTKGSFYWHFTDRADLLNRMLEFWSQKYTDVIVENPEFLEGDPGEGLLAVLVRVRKEKLEEFELALRSWARLDPNVDKTVREVYRKRTDFVRGFFKRLGFRGMEVEIRARLALCYLAWERSMYDEDSEASRLKMLKLQHALLIKR